MGVYFGEAEITNIDDLAPAQGQDITQAFFGNTEVFTVWGEYDGTLPAQYSANGSTLADYRIYGAAGGVGDDSGTAYGYEVDIITKSKNIFNCSGEWKKPYSGSTITVSNTVVTITGTWYVYKVVDVTSNTDYYISFDILSYTVSYGCAIYGANADGTINNSDIISGRFQGSITINSGGRTRIALLFYSGNSNAGTCAYDRILVELASESTEFQPYSNTTTPIYIGSSPLNAYEYIDYASGKIYRWSNNQLSVPEVREKVNEEVTCTVSNDGVYTLTVSDTVQSDRYFSFQYNPVEIPNEKTWTVATVAENILSNNGMITLGDEIHPVISVYIQNNGYNTTRPFGPLGTTYILDRMSICVRAGTPAGTFTLRPMLMYIEPTDPPVPLPALPTVDGTNIVDYAGQSAAVPSRFVAKYRKEEF